MAALLVSLLFSPSFAEVGTPVTVTIVLRSEAKETITLTLPASDACLAANQLQLELTDPHGKVLTALPCSGDELKQIELAPGAKVELTVPLTKLFPKVKWSAGRWKLDSTWKRLEGVKEQVSTSADAIVRAKSLQTFTIKRKGSVTLTDGAKLTFLAHGHKSIGPGQKSPLIIRGEFNKQEFDESVFPDEDRSFILDDRSFELLEWKYDESMKLKYYGKVQREFDD